MYLLPVFSFSFFFTTVTSTASELACIIDYHLVSVCYPSLGVSMWFRCVLFSPGHLPFSLLLLVGPLLL